MGGGLNMIRTVFRVPTPKHTWNSSDRQTDRQQDNPESLYQDNPDTYYKRCSRIAKVLLFYVRSWQGEER